jgi:DNA-binding NarL/FixJ family response regulator
MNPTPLDGTIVLIVDDVPENVSVLSDALDEAGCMVLVALDGKSAIERLSYITPDIILLDAVMPGMDGFDTCRHMKRLESARDVPVVFMTGLTESEHVVAGFACGGVDYVTKPIRPDEVLARVAAHVSTGRALRAAREAAERAASQGPEEPAADLCVTYGLTTRELEVLEWLAKGKTNRDIADILGMSPRTVNKHLEHIYEKLGVETRSAATSIVLTRGSGGRSDGRVSG